MAPPVVVPRLKLSHVMLTDGAVVACDWSVAVVVVVDACDNACDGAFVASPDFSSKISDVTVEPVSLLAAGGERVKLWEYLDNMEDVCSFKLNADLLDTSGISRYCSDSLTDLALDVSA